MTKQDDQEGAARGVRLRQLMADHGLTVKGVAAILNRSATTIRIWRVEGTARPIPENELKLLELTLSAPQNGEKKT